MIISFPLGDIPIEDLDYSIILSPFAQKTNQIRAMVGSARTNYWSITRSGEILF